MAKKNHKKINASPTKEFFIHMLVKDIALTRAIIDLVDNSVDGARQLRANGNYDRLFVRVEIRRDFFKITDNCGGISEDLARNYAFRFGRPADAPSLSHSIGQFGVGMKRALFKIGNWFRIESTDKDCRFVVEVDVDKWKRDPDPEWHFQFTDGPTYKKYSVGKTGTVIEVRTLHDEVANSFELETFESALRREMQAAHQDAMNNGLVIELNGIALEVRPTQLLRSDDLRPARKQLSFSNGMPVNVDLFAGIAVSEPDLAGWYVICNGRMVLEADQSRVTGWGERKQTTIPKFHNQFARFRGYAYFDSDNAALLPWNTTKTGVDIDSPHFRAVRQEMLTLTRPVIDFLNQLDAEQAADKQPLDHLVKEAQAVNLTELEPSDKFIWPKHKKPRKGPQLQKIQYERPLEQVKKVMEELNASTFKEVGEKTFEYFYDLECE